MVCFKDHIYREIEWRVPNVNEEYMFIEYCVSIVSDVCVGFDNVYLFVKGFGNVMLGDMMFGDILVMFWLR